MSTVIKALALIALASPIFAQYPMPYGYYPVGPTPVIYAPAPAQHFVDPAGYRPTYLHSIMNPYYAQQYALDLSYAMNYERRMQFMVQAERQRMMLLAKAPEMRAKKVEKRQASQQRVLNKQIGVQPPNVQQPAVADTPDVSDLAADLRSADLRSF